MRKSRCGCGEPPTRKPAPTIRTTRKAKPNINGLPKVGALISVTAYHSFCGEVEASNTPTIRRLTHRPAGLSELVRAENGIRTSWNDDSYVSLTLCVAQRRDGPSRKITPKSFRESRRGSLNSLPERKQERSEARGVIRLVRRGAPHPSPNTSPSRESRAYSAGLFFWTDASERPRHPSGAVDMRAKNFGAGRRVFLPSATLGNPRVSPTAVWSSRLPTTSCSPMILSRRRGV